MTTHQKPILFGARGGGSAIIEALFMLSDQDYEIEYLDWGTLDAPDGRLAAVNPLREIPTLQLPDGTILTQSAAICLWLGDTKPACPLIPAPDSPVRPAFLRHLVWLVASIYPTFTFSDHPERHIADTVGAERLRMAMEKRRETLWRQLEGQLPDTQWMLGEQMTVLDIYISVMTRWRPRRVWFKQNCPHLHTIAKQVDRMPALETVWRENFN